MPYIMPANRHQETMFPTVLDDYIEQGSIVRVYDAFVNSLDMAACGFERSNPAAEGRPGYDPRDLLKLYIYGYSNKIRSSRKLAAEAGRNVEVMWLIGGLRPDFRTIADFRKDNHAALEAAFREFNATCLEMGLLSCEYSSIDGSKFRAVNSKDRNFTLSKLDDRIDRIDAHIADYLRILDASDAEEPAERGFTAEEIRGKVKALEERKARYEGYRSQMELAGDTQMSVTDPDSRLMKTHGGFEVCYNVQAAVDAGSHIVTALEVTDRPSDHGLLESVSAKIKECYATETAECVADKGYNDPADLMACLESGVIPNVFPCDGSDTIGLQCAYEEALIDEETRASASPADLAKCLRAGVVPKKYEDVIDGIEVFEKAVYDQVDHDQPDLTGVSDEKLAELAAEGWFVRDLARNRVICPMGKVLRACHTRKDGRTNYRNPHACRNCTSKCTSREFKEVNLAPGKVLSVCRAHSRSGKARCVGGRHRKKRLVKFVKIDFRPDRKKLDSRKCLSEHPFGTLKRTLDGSYLLLKGKAKVTAEMSLLFLAYNIKRATAMVGAERLLEGMGSR